jgi:hypothetical protein
LVEHCSSRSRAGGLVWRAPLHRRLDARAGGHRSRGLGPGSGTDRESTRSLPPTQPPLPPNGPSTRLTSCPETPARGRAPASRERLRDVQRRTDRRAGVVRGVARRTLVTRRRAMLARGRVYFGFVSPLRHAGIGANVLVRGGAATRSRSYSCHRRAHGAPNALPVCRAGQNNDGCAVEGGASVPRTTVVPVAGVGAGSGGYRSAVAASRTLR